MPSVSELCALCVEANLSPSSIVALPRWVHLRLNNCINVKVNLAEKQQRLLDAFLPIPDPQERLAAIVARSAQIPALAPADRTDANRVPGCVSAVWLAAAIDPATRRLRLRIDADSPLVKGLVALLCELYDDTDPAEAATFQPELLEKLRITQNLSPTRRNGLAAVQARINSLATAHLP